MSRLARLAVIPFAAWCVLSFGRAGFAHQSPQTQTPAHVVPPEDRVDINSASLEQLMKVPGMTRTWAARIIRFRPYRTKNDLVDRGVVTNEVYDRIRDYIIAHRIQQ